jgi:hypothetical protein
MTFYEFDFVIFFLKMQKWSVGIKTILSLNFIDIPWNTLINRNFNIAGIAGAVIHCQNSYLLSRRYGVDHIDK